MTDYPKDACTPLQMGRKPVPGGTHRATREVDVRPHPDLACSTPPEWETTLLDGRRIRQCTKHLTGVGTGAPLSLVQKVERLTRPGDPGKGKPRQDHAPKKFDKDAARRAG